MKRGKEIQLGAGGGCFCGVCMCVWGGSGGREM